MNTRQWKITIVMIKTHVVPARRVMTGRAVCSKFPAVIVILLVAGITIGGRAFELLIDMTRLTGDFGMLALQFERREIMVKLCRSPTRCCVAIGATGSESPLMRLILLVTGITILWSGLEVA
jgi:hypothetical protein